eukprot:TRINITY_DN33887_c0_g1_i1.p1 TRINITY_DN33887_c0_g1~~TRINITY_DN33887_c0_g1_i1.p1  ORF type:complete len:554 (+),score=50.37 TRINITY_DN33887_c0_g1_i1:96-1757(+)
MDFELEREKLWGNIRQLESELRKGNDRIRELESMLDYVRKEKDVSVKTLEDQLDQRTTDLVMAEERMRALKMEYTSLELIKDDQMGKLKRQLADATLSNRRMQERTKTLEAEREDLDMVLSGSPVDNVMDRIKLKVGDLTKKMGQLILTIAGWTDKEAVFKKAFLDIKQVVVDLKGEQHPGLKWNLKTIDITSLSPYYKSGLHKYLQELVIAWDMMPVTRYTLTTLLDEIVTNGEWLFRFAAECKPKDSIQQHKDAHSSPSPPTVSTSRKSSHSSHNHANRETLVTSPSLTHRSQSPSARSTVTSSYRSTSPTTHRYRDTPPKVSSWWDPGHKRKMSPTPKRNSTTSQPHPTSGGRRGNPPATASATQQHLRERPRSVSPPASVRTPSSPHRTGTPQRRLYRTPQKQQQREEKKDQQYNNSSHHNHIPHSHTDSAIKPPSPPWSHQNQHHEPDGFGAQPHRYFNSKSSVAVSSMPFGTGDQAMPGSPTSPHSTPRSSAAPTSAYPPQVPPSPPHIPTHSELRPPGPPAHAASPPSNLPPSPSHMHHMWSPPGI